MRQGIEPCGEGSNLATDTETLLVVKVKMSPIREPALTNRPPPFAEVQRFLSRVPPFVRACLISVGVAVGDDGVAVVQEPVEHADRGGVFRQVPSPGVERPVGSDAKRTPLVGGRDEPERQWAPVSSSGAKPSAIRAWLFPVPASPIMQTFSVARVTRDWGGGRRSLAGARMRRRRTPQGSWWPGSSLVASGCGRWARRGM